MTDPKLMLAEIDRLRAEVEQWQELANQGLHIERQIRTEIERLREALRPFANAVYNDNGDVTYSPMHTTDDYWRAYCVLRRAALENRPPASS